jgi:hypothetical protein
MGSIPLKRDDTSTINLTKNPIMHSRTKRIDIIHYILIDHVLKGDIEVTSLAKEQFFKVRREHGILDENDI